MYIRFTKTKKRCSDCEKWLPKSAFYSAQNTSGVCSYCIECYKPRNAKKHKDYYATHKKEVDAKNKKWKENNFERYKKQPSQQPNYRREYKRELTYGISPDEYRKMWAFQRGHCAISGCQNRIRDVDHNHKTGKTRALLCGFCNRALGLFRNSPSLLRNAAKYLEKHGVR
jgi:hypothetical protein